MKKPKPENQKDQGALVWVRISPRSREGKVEGIKEGTVQVRVREEPTEGQANEACLQLMAEFFGISRASVRIERGAKARMKQLRVKGVTQEEVKDLLEKSFPSLEEQ